MTTKIKMLYDTITEKQFRSVRLTEILLLLALFALASSLRFYALDSVPPGLYIDEISPILLSWESRDGDASLPLATILVYIMMGVYWISNTDISAFIIRTPAVIYGSALVPLIYLLGKSMFGRNVGLVSAIIASVMPWTLHFSRYEIPSMAFAFYITLIVYLSYRYATERRKIFFYFFLAAVGIALYTHAVALIFLALLLPLILVKLFQNQSRTEILKGITITLASFILFILPYLILYTADTRPYYANYSVLAPNDESAISKIQSITSVASWHLSPDFLILNSGLSYAEGASGFNTPITFEGLIYYGFAGKVGELNYFGIYAFIGIAGLVAARSYNLQRYFLIIWIIAYAIAAGFSYFDNPNAARNAEGAPAFALLIGLGTIFAYNYLKERKYIESNPFGKYLLLLMIITSIALPAIWFISFYYNEFPNIANKQFDNDYKMLFTILDAEYPGEKIVIQDISKPYVEKILQYYTGDGEKRQYLRTDTPVGEEYAGSIFIARYESDIQYIAERGVQYTPITSIRYDDGQTAFIMVRLN